MYYPFQFCIHESYTQILPISTPSSHFGVRVGDCIADIEIKWYLIESGCCFWRHQPNRCRSFDSYHGTSSVGSLVDLDVFRLFCAITRRILLWLTISVFPFFCFLYVFKSCGGLCIKQRILWINIYRKCPNTLSFTAYPSARSGILPPTRRDMGVLVEILQRTFISRDSSYSLSSVNFVWMKTE